MLILQITGISGKKEAFDPQESIRRSFNFDDIDSSLLNSPSWHYRLWVCPCFLHNAKTASDSFQIVERDDDILGSALPDLKMNLKVYRQAPESPKIHILPGRKLTAVNRGLMGRKKWQPRVLLIIVKSSSSYWLCTAPPLSVDMVNFVGLGGNKCSAKSTVRGSH